MSLAGVLGGAQTDARPLHLLWRGGRDRARAPELRAREAAADRAQQDPDEGVDYNEKGRKAAERDLRGRAGDRVRDEDARREQGPADEATVGAAPAVLVLEPRQHAAHGGQAGETPVGAR